MCATAGQWSLMQVSTSWVRSVSYLSLLSLSVRLPLSRCSFLSVLLIYQDVIRIHGTRPASTHMHGLNPKRS